MWKRKTSLLQVLQNQLCEKEDVELQVPTCVHSDVAESSTGVQRCLFSWPFFGWCGNVKRRSTNDVGGDWTVNERHWRTHDLALCRSDSDPRIAPSKAETMG